MNSETVNSMPVSKLAFPRKSLALLGIVALMAVFLAVLSVGNASAAGPTYVESDITTDTTWYAADSPYVLNDTITVAPGATLTIEPGVQVNATGNIFVAGTLIADGTSELPIVFTPNLDVMSFWEGLIFDQSSGSMLNYVDIDNATTAVWMTDSSVPITNSKFEWCMLGVFAEFDNVDGAFTVTGNEFKHMMVGSISVSVTATSILDDMLEFSVPVTIEDNYFEDAGGVSVSRYAESNAESTLALSGAVTISGNELAMTDPIIEFNAISYIGALNTYDISMATMSGDVTISANNIYPYNATLGDEFLYGIYVERSVEAAGASDAYMDSPVYAFDNIIVASYYATGAYVYSYAYADEGAIATLEGNVELYTNEVSEANYYNAFIVELDAFAFDEAVVNVNSEVWILNNRIINCSSFAYVDYEDLYTDDLAVATLDIGVLITGNVVTGAYGGIEVRTGDVYPGFESSLYIIRPIVISGNELTISDGMAIVINDGFYAMSSESTLSVAGGIAVAGNVVNITGYGNGIFVNIDLVADPSYENVTCQAIFDGDVTVQSNDVNMAFGNTGIYVYVYAWASNDYGNTTALVSIGNVYVRSNSVDITNAANFYTYGIFVEPSLFADNYANGSASATIGDVVLRENDVTIVSEWGMWSKDVYGVYLSSEDLYAYAEDGNASMAAGSIIAESNNVNLWANNASYSTLYGVYVEAYDVYAESYYGGYAQTTIGSMLANNNMVAILTNATYSSSAYGVYLYNNDLYAYVYDGGVEATLVAGDILADDNIVAIASDDLSYLNINGVYAECYLYSEAYYEGSAAAEMGAFTTSGNQVTIDVSTIYQSWSVEGVYLYTYDLWVGAYYDNASATAAYGNVAVDNNVVVVTANNVDYGYVYGVDYYVEYASADAYYDGSATLTTGDFTQLNNQVTITIDGCWDNLYVYAVEYYFYYGYAYQYDGVGTAVANYGSFLVQNNDVSFVGSNLSYSHLEGVYVYIDDLYAQSYYGYGYGTALLTAGDISVSDNEVSASYENSNEANVDGVYADIYYLYAESDNDANASATYGDIAMDNNIVTIEAEYVRSVSVDGVYLYIYEMYAEADYGNATLVVGDYSASGNLVTLNANNTQDTNFYGVYFDAEYIYAESDGNWTASATFGSTYVMDNVVAATSENMGYYYGGGNYNFEGVYVYLYDAYADAYGYDAVNDCAATRTMGDLLVSNNFVSSICDDPYYVYVEGVYVELYYTYAYSDSAIVSSSIGDIAVDNNVVIVEAQYVDYYVDIDGVYVYLYDMYSSTDYGSVTSVVGDITVCGNAIAVDVNGADYLDFYGAYLDIEYPYAYAYYGDASMALGDIAVDNNVVIVEAQYVESLYVYSVYVYIYDMYAEADYGNATLVAGDFTVCGNLVDFAADYAYYVDFDGIYFSTEYTYAESDGNWTASATFGSTYVMDNQVSVSADNMDSYGYYSDLNVDAIYVYVYDAYADAYGYAAENDCAAYRTMGDFSVYNNTVEVSCSYVYSSEVWGVDVDFDYAYAYADNGVASNVMGQFDVSANTVMSSFVDCEYAEFWAIDVEIYDASTEAYYGATATLVAGDITVCDNTVTGVAMDSYSLYGDGVYFEVYDMYVDSYYGSSASATFGSIREDNNVVEFDANELYYVYFDGVELGVYYTSAYAYEDGSAQIAIGDISISGNTVVVTAAGYSEEIDVYGVYLDIYDGYAEADYYSEAMTTYGNVAVDNNVVTLDYEYVYYAYVDGIDVYVDYIYSEAYDGNTTLTMGNISLSGNMITMVAGYAYDVGFYGLALEFDDIYAEIYGDGSASASFGATLVENNIVAADCIDMGYWSSGYFDFEGINIEVDDAYADAEYADESISVASYEAGDVSVNGNSIEVSCYEAYSTYLEGIYADFDDLYAYAYESAAVAARTIGSFYFSNNYINYYVDEGELYFQGIGASINEMYASAYYGATASNVGGDFIMADNTLVVDTDNTWYVSGDWDAGFGFDLDEMGAYAYEDSTASVTFGDFEVLYNTVTIDYVENFYAVSVYLEYLNADAEYNSTASAAMGQMRAVGNEVTVSEYADDVYGVYVYMYDIYADAYEDSTAGVSIQVIDIVANMVSLSGSAYDCYGIYYENYYDNYASAEYGGIAEFAISGGINVNDNTVTMADAESCDGIYVDPSFGSWSEYRNAVSTVTAVLSVCENTVVLTPSYEWAYNDGITVYYYAEIYYDESDAFLYGGLAVDNNFVDLGVCYDGTGIYVDEYAYEDSDSNNGAGIIDVPVSVSYNTVNGGEYGIYIYDAINVAVIGNVVTNADYAGIYLEYVDDVVFTDNIITGCYYGLYLYEVYGITITDQVFSGNEYGVYMEYVYDLLFSDNVVADNEYVGLEIEDGQNLTFVNNVFSGNEDGIEMDDVYDVLFCDNFVTENEYVGAYVDDSFNVTFVNNIFTYNGDGAEFDYSDLLFIEDNVFSFNAGDGLYLYDCGEEGEPVIVGNNTFEANGSDGLYAEYCDYMTIYNGVYIDNGEYGLYSYGGYRNQWIVDVAAEVSNNDVQFDGRIYVYDGATMVLEYVSWFYLEGYDSGIEVMEGGCLEAIKVYFDGYWGWYFTVNGQLVMIDCWIDDCNGLYLGPTSEASIDTSVFEDGNNGIIIDGSSPRISGCTIYYNQDGIEVKNGAAPVIKSCLIYDNERGIYAEDADLIYVVDNVIMGNYEAGIYAKNVVGKIHDNVLFMNYREIFLIDSTVTVEDNQIGYASLMGMRSDWTSLVMQVIMDTVDVEIEMYDFEDVMYEIEDLLYEAFYDLDPSNHIGIYAIDSSVEAKGNTYGWLNYAVYMIGGELVFSDCVETNYFTISWVNADGMKMTYEMPFTVYDGIFATDADVTIVDACFDVIDDAVFLEACSGIIANTVFMAGDFDVYLMEGSVVGIYGTEWEKVKAEDTSMLYVEYLLTLTVKDQDGFGIAGAMVKIFDADGAEWASGSTDSKGVFKAYLAHHAITDDGEVECNEYTVNATKDDVNGSATIKMNNADTSASLTLTMKKNTIFGMDPVVVGIIALVIVLVIVGALFFARKK